VSAKYTNALNVELLPVLMLSAEFETRVSSAFPYLLSALNSCLCCVRLLCAQCGHSYLFQLDVLHNVLEKLQNRRMGGWERKTSRLPVCYIGDFCSVKKGSRFGQLCDCPRGSKCNFFFLKCL
uniref:Cocaine- and amphetamine-regulated transcript protein n=1 Tax=Scleropages formosus TaxID=113540 RepID=A0A8C9V2D7_SCLFO